MKAGQARDEDIVGDTQRFPDGTVNYYSPRYVQRHVQTNAVYSFPTLTFLDRIYRYAVGRTSLTEDRLGSSQDLYLHGQHDIKWQTDDLHPSTELDVKQIGRRHYRHYILSCSGTQPCLCGTEAANGPPCTSRLID